MGLATELIFNTKRQSSNRESYVDSKATKGTFEGWATLNHVVYGLIGEHEPNPELDARLRYDLRVMQLSGLVAELKPGSSVPVYKQASQIMSEFLRLLPYSR